MRKPGLPLDPEKQQTDEDFWEEMTRLAASSLIVIDRAQGTAHPQHPDMIYPFDYGYIEGTSASDGGGIDVFIGSQSDHALTGILCTFDTIKRDAEIKVLLGCTMRDVWVIRAFLGDMRTMYVPHQKEDKR
jgi:inorganic pyrophosphatase